jgi:hypothetical protein
MARPCLICSSVTKTKLAGEMISAGNTDRAIADALNVAEPAAAPLSAMAVSRHRRNHVLDVTKQRLAVISKGSDARQNRVELAAAAAADAPTPQQFVEAFFGLKAQSEKLQRIEDRLERMAAVAETGGSTNGVAQLAAQQLRSVEVGAKLASTGGYAPAKSIGEGNATAFSVNFHFSGGMTETITVRQPAVAHPAGMVDEGKYDNAPEFAPPPLPAAPLSPVARLARGFGAGKATG